MFSNTEQKKSSFSQEKELNTTNTETNTSSSNPFIHGTSSLMLALLDKTNMEILSPIDMIKKYQLAPLGGYEARTDTWGKILKSDAMPSFTRLKSESEGSLEYIIDKHVFYDDFDFDKVNWNRLVLSSFNNIDLLLINLAKAKQSGGKNEDLLNNEDAELLISQMSGVIQCFYLVMLLGKNIHPNLSLHEHIDEETKQDYTDVILERLTYRNLLNRIIDEKLDIESIYKNPTPYALNKIRHLFILPKRTTVEIGLNEYKDVILPDTHIFTETPADYSKCSFDHLEPNYLFTALIKNVRNYSIEAILNKLFSGNLTPKCLGVLEQKLLVYTETLREKLALLKMILEKDYSASLIPKDSLFVKEPFPILLMSEEESKFSAMNPNDPYREVKYSATSPLTFGTDIKSVAVRSLKEKTLLKEYFERCGVNNIDIMLFDQLFNQLKQATAINKERPALSYEASHMRALQARFKNISFFKMINPFHIDNTANKEEVTNKPGTKSLSSN